MLICLENYSLSLSFTVHGQILRKALSTSSYNLYSLQLDLIKNMAVREAKTKCRGMKSSDVPVLSSGDAKEVFHVWRNRWERELISRKKEHFLKISEEGNSGKGAYFKSWGHMPLVPPGPTTRGLEQHFIFKRPGCNSRVSTNFLRRYKQWHTGRIFVFSGFAW